jgi:iron complex outermembrane receptor protein
MLKATLLGSCASVLAAGLLGAPTMASADQAATEGRPVQTAVSAVETIVVTAQRREESAQTVPIAIEAFSGAKLQKLEVTTTTQLSNFVPGLNITRANVGAVPYLRGVGNFTATPGNEAAIATYVDEVYHPAAGGSNYVFNNIDRIEVLKGPQGTLFGRNAAGGVLSVTTKDPTHTPYFRAELGYGSYNTVTGNFYGSMGLTDNLAADIAVYAEHQGDGWGKNLFDNTPAYLSWDTAVRTKWVFTPDDLTKVTFIAHTQHTRNDVASASNLIPGTTSLGGYTHFGGFYDVNTNFDGYGETINYGASLNIQHKFSWATFKSITAWESAHWRGVIENDSSPADIQEARLNSKEQTETEELQLSSPAEAKISWIGGLYFYLDNAGHHPFTQYGNAAASRPGRQQMTFSNQRTVSYAGYAQATATIFPATRLTVGLRYTDDSRHFVGHQQDINGVVFNPGDQTAHAGALTYRFSLDHQFTDDILGYVSYNRGFKSGNFNANSPTLPATKPEFLDAFEVGVKSDLLDHRVRLNAAGYYYTFKDLQVQQQLVTGTLLTNAAAARYYGIDVDLSAVLTPALSVQASLNASNATYTSFPNAVLNFPAANGLGFTQHAGDATGFTIPYEDKFTASMNGIYSITDDLGLTLGVAYHNGFPFDTQGIVRQPSYWYMNGALAWTAPDKAWGVKLWSDNLLNTHYYAQKQVSNAGETYSPAAPLTVGVKIYFQH